MTVFERLRELEANATPGPWFPRGDFIYRGARARLPLASYVSAEDVDFIVAARNLWGPLIAVAEAADTCADKTRFIYEKREDMARLRLALAALERAVKEQP